MCLYSCDVKASLLQSTVADDPNEIIQICCFPVQKNIVITIINVENGFVAYFCVETVTNLIQDLKRIKWKSRFKTKGFICKI